jgi:hypothetical protein
MIRRVSIVLLVLLAVTAFTGVATAINNSETPGSVLVFPKFESGPGEVDNIGLPESSFEISVVCPKGALCSDGTSVRIRLHWVCGARYLGQPCQETDFNISTTVNGTVRFNPDNVPEPTESVPITPVAPPPCEEGYLIAWVIDSFGRPIKFDGLIGDEVLRPSPEGTFTIATAVNAVPIQAASGLAQNALTDVNGNHSLDFNGLEYQQLSGKIYGSVYYPKFDASRNELRNTELILLTLDVHSNAFNNPTFVNLNFYNEDEQLRSTSTAFFCWGDFDLANNGLDQNFGTKGLVFSTRAAKQPILGVADRTGPVTLLGIVITEESDYLAGFAVASTDERRAYAYPLFEGSAPVNTRFIP